MELKTVLPNCHSKEHYSAHARVEPHVQHHVFTWFVEKFSSVHLSHTATSPDDTLDRAVMLRSPTFTIGGSNAPTSTWALNLLPRFTEGGPDDTICLAIQLQLMAKSSHITDGNFEVSLVDTAGRKLHAKKKNLDLVITTLRDGWPKYLPRKTLLDGKDTLLPKDRLAIRCDLTVLYKASVVNVDGLNIDDLKKLSTRKLLADLRTLFSSGVHCDLVIRCGRNHFTVHWVILHARSPVFAKMLEAKAEESPIPVLECQTDGGKRVIYYLEEIYQAQVIDVSDVPEDTMKELLNYIYGGDVSCLTSPVCLELYPVATRFGLGDLAADCAAVVAKDLSLTTVCPAAAFADACGDKRLFNAVKRFVVLNAAVVSRSDDWIELLEQNPSLVCRLLKQ